jgi:tagaturonate reductase
MHPETILQFGTGRFLRAFADLFVQQANADGQRIGRIVVVQSTGSARAEGLNANPDGYHVVVRGLENGQTVERVEKVSSISRALHAATQWPKVLEVAASPELRYLISNTTEAGYACDPGDKLEDQPARAFPAKLTQVLWHRFQKQGSPLFLLPCELIEHNAAKLRKLVEEQAQTWKLPQEFRTWLTESCTWLESLVDRIVVGPSQEHPLFSKDPMLLMTEPYALWAIELPKNRPFSFITHPSIELVPDLAPYFLRKVRILNGIHTALVGKFYARGFDTVQRALREPEVMDWVLALLYEEIIPVLVGRVDNVARYARQVLDRFQNPFLEHRLRDIAVGHVAKKQIRLETTRAEFQKMYGFAPKRIAEALVQDPQ